jgi:exportin-2 (importin alpha re-exporter)
MMIELRKSLEKKFVPLFEELTKAHFWEESGNRPALVRLIQDFIAFGGNQLIPNLQALVPVLGTFQKLLSNKQQDYLGFYIMERYFTFVSLYPLLFFLFAHY